MELRGYCIRGNLRLDTVGVLHFQMEEAFRSMASESGAPRSFFPLSPVFEPYHVLIELRVGLLDVRSK